MLRLTILQQGEAISKNNTLDLEVIKELRNIRDKVNKVLDMVAVETSKATTVDVKAEEEVEETVTEAVSQLQLEQSKEFDPLEQSQSQVSQHCSAVFSTLIGPGPTRLGSHWSRASECCMGRQCYPIKLPVVII